MSLIDLLVEELAPLGIRLRKAQPRGQGLLTMELETSDGEICAGQWHHDGVEAARVASLLRNRFGTGSVDMLSQGRLLVQHAGADRKLPALAHLLRQPDATLVAHRPERRAVVRLGDARYVKVVRPGRTAEVVTPLRVVRPAALRVPEVLSVDDVRGTVMLTAVAGRTLFESLGSADLDDGSLVENLLRVGSGLRQLHSHAGMLPRAVHDLEAEVAATHGWLKAAGENGLLDPGVWGPVLLRVVARLPAPPARTALLHRDLHDKQIVLAAPDRAGLLDLDLATHGDPAIDLANLLAHLDLRVRQGVCSTGRATRCMVALLEGYGPDVGLVQRLPPYTALIRLRLAGVYSFRPSPPGLVEGLLHAAGRVPESVGA